MRLGYVTRHAAQELYRVAVREELEAYGAGLADKPEVVALNKIDTIDAELTAALADELAAESGGEVIPVSGATGAGVEAVLDAVVAQVGRIAEEAREERDWSPL